MKAVTFLTAALTLMPLSCARPQQGQLPETKQERTEPSRQTEAGVTVTVSESRSGDSAVYRYTVVNGSGKPLVGLRIGFDYPVGEARLTIPPVGWTLEAGLSPSSVIAPPGWAVRLVTTEESDSFTLEWSSDGGPEADIKPGADESRFAVTVPAATAEYGGAKFDVTFSDSTHVHGQAAPGVLPDK